jgi:hypothetical protein
MLCYAMLYYVMIETKKFSGTRSATNLAAAPEFLASPLHLKLLVERTSPKLSVVTSLCGDGHPTFIHPRSLIFPLPLLRPTLLGGRGNALH